MSNKTQIISTICIILFVSSGIFPQSNLLSKLNYKYQNKTFEIQKGGLDQNAVSYLHSGQILRELNEVLKTNNLIDSIVSSSFSSGYQKLKYSFTYDDNDNLIQFLAEFYNNGVHGYWNRFYLDYNQFQKISSLYNETWKNGAWESQFQEYYSYDDKGNNIDLIKQEWDSTQNSWMNTELYKYEYDSNNNQISSIRSDWINGAWEYYSKKVSEFDISNNKTRETSYRWAWTDWEFDDQKIWIFNESNRVISEYYQVWDYTSNNWRDSALEEYLYNDLDQLEIDRRFLWDDVTDGWEYDQLLNYFYTESGKLQLEIKDRFNNGEWTKEYEHNYSYDEYDNLTSFERSYNWVELDWTNRDKWNYIYDTQNNCIGGNFETWFSNHWVGADIEMLLQPEYWLNPPDHYLLFFYSISGYEFSNYYPNPTDLNKNDNYENVLSLSQNYPNPFNPTTTISYSIPRLSNVVLKISDILGKELVTLVNKRQSKGQYDLVFDAKNLSSGIYFYSIYVTPDEMNHDYQIRTKKMLIIK